LIATAFGARLETRHVGGPGWGDRVRSPAARRYL